MDVTTINALYDTINEMAASILAKDTEELAKMKIEFDEYVARITTKMTGSSRDAAAKEFEKCRLCAREWMAVYCDTTYNHGMKTDILKEEAMGFFFSQDERIVAVQKNFFFLGMIDEILNPSEPFSEHMRKGKIANARIRILAREQGLKANCKNRPSLVTDKKCEDRLWFFGDDRNCIQSSEEGLTDEEAVDYLLD